MLMSMFTVFGGLALFIYGMKLMSDGLHKAAGERMREILRFFSSNRFIAILAGTLVTAVIQSSSATTVMVIGFVNAGLLSLLNSIGILFGANIGTTITAQLVAFDIEWVIMPCIIIGVILTFVTRPSWRGRGDTILGFGLLFFGMYMMSDELKLLADNQAVLSLFSYFDCAPRNGWMPVGAVFGAIGIGMGVTMIMQSSSACTGIIIALGAGGLINLYTAVALVLGSNIGTTITAQIAAIPANRIAKQTALAHTLFNIIGVILVVLTFWLPFGDTSEPIFFRIVNALSGSGELPRRIANAHTLFNGFTTLILTPFIPLLARVCEAIIPVHEPELKFQYLENHLLKSPPLALVQTVSALRKMLHDAWVMIDCALKTYARNDAANQALAKELPEREEGIDAMQAQITEYLSKLMLLKLTGTQARAVPVLLHCTNDLERIGDHAAIILEQIDQIKASGVGLSSLALGELEQLHALLIEQVECASGVLNKQSAKYLARADELKEHIRALTEKFEDNHIQRLKDGSCLPVIGVYYIELLAEIRKVSRHIANVTDRAKIIESVA